MKQKTIGDWSEVYVFLTLLQKKELVWIDDKGKSRTDKIGTIIRPQTPEIEYIINEKSVFVKSDKGTVEVSYDNINSLANVFKKEFEESRDSKDKQKIKFPPKELTDNLEQILLCPFVRANGNTKSDIKIRFKEGDKTLGCSIKSFAGARPTIFGGGKDKSLMFEYKIKTKRDLPKGYLESLNTMKLKKRIKKIISDGHELIFQPHNHSLNFVKSLNNIEKISFDNNHTLKKDKSLEFLLADLLLYVNSKNRSYIKPYFENQSETNIQLIKRFLLAAVIGMRPTEEWTCKEPGDVDVLICVEKDLEIGSFGINKFMVSDLFDRIVFVNHSTPDIDNFNEPSQRIYLQIQCEEK